MWIQGGLVILTVYDQFDYIWDHLGKAPPKFVLEAFPGRFN